jgi:hypothetical protein
VYEGEDVCVSAGSSVEVRRWMVCVSWAGVGLGRGGKVDQVGSGTHLGEEVGITHSCLCLASDVDRWRD